jgi:hypothetical protein
MTVTSTPLIDAIERYENLFAVGNEYGFVLDLREHVVVRTEEMSYVFLNLDHLKRAMAQTINNSPREMMLMSAFCFDRQTQNFLKTRFAINGDHFSGLWNNLK